MLIVEPHRSPVYCEFAGLIKLVHSLLDPEDALDLRMHPFLGCWVSYTEPKPT